jgi:hypothetical protein
LPYLAKQKTFFPLKTKTNERKIKKEDRDKKQTLNVGLVLAFEIREIGAGN